MSRNVGGGRQLGSKNAVHVRLDAERHREPTVNAEELRRAVESMPRLRLTGEQLDAIDPDPEKRFYVDWDEYDEFVRLDDVRRALDAARTARVAGLDRERLAGDIIEKHIIRVARYFWPDGSHIETFAREALAALNSAASIEQEPGEDDLLAKVRQAVAAIPQSLRHEDVPRKGGWSVGFLDAMTRVLATIDAMGESR